MHCFSSGIYCYCTNTVTKSVHVDNSLSKIQSLETGLCSFAELHLTEHPSPFYKVYQWDHRCSKQSMNYRSRIYFKYQHLI